jgi:hypothetical protein
LLGEANRPGFADDLAANVVAIGDVDGGLDTSAPDAMSMSVNNGSATPPARLFPRGALTAIATGSSSSTNLAMSMSCTPVSVIAIIALKWPGEKALRCTL